MLGALIFAIATAVCQGYQVKNGMGRHMMTLSPEEGINSLKALFASIIVYNFSLTLIKVSIVLQYLRIAVDKHVRLACHALMVFVLLTWVETLFSGTFTCFPVAKFWDDRIPGKCINKFALWFANAGINITQDIWLIILPFFMLRNMFLRGREKISLMLILGLGGFASVASILRLNALHILSVTHDITWDNPGTALWSTIEVNVGIICASLPCIRALAAQMFPRLFKSSVGGQGNGYYGTGGQPKASKASHNDFHISEVRGNIMVKTDIELEGKSGYSGRSPESTSSTEALPKSTW